MKVLCLGRPVPILDKYRTLEGAGCHTILHLLVNFVAPHTVASGVVIASGNHMRLNNAHDSQRLIELVNCLGVRPWGDDRTLKVRPEVLGINT